jgi:hypothetical protein
MGTAMTSEGKIAANRANARRSTGPKTPEGKAAVRLNNLRHGLYSRESLIRGESEADLVAFGKRLRATLAPATELELLLADRIVSTAWRLRRLITIEGSVFDKEQVLANTFGGYSGDRMVRLSRYEVTLDRTLIKCLHELQRLQASRRGEAVPPPEAIDVTITGPDQNDADCMALNGQNRGASARIINGTADHPKAQ